LKERPRAVLATRARGLSEPLLMTRISPMQNIPFSKAVATAGGSALTGAAVWLNAEHIAASEGWASPLVLAGIIVTICAAVTPPLAERAAKTEQPFKAVMLWAFFALAVSFSLTASISRSGGHRDAEVASAEQINIKARLAQEAYAAAQATVADECKKRGSRCRAAEEALPVARAALMGAAPARTADPAAERIAHILGVSEASVALYSPLALPLGLELGGFIFLAVGLAPRRRKAEPITPRRDPDVIDLPIVEEVPAIAAPIMAKAGSAAYYRQRLEREHPALAAAVDRGELSVFSATISAGMRKPPKKLVALPSA
jgi:hypothetical protein